MRLLSVRQMNDLEKQADIAGLSYERMMANAGKGLAVFIHDRFYGEGGKTITGLVGSGNNGGDTLIALTHLSRLGWATRGYLIKERALGDGLVQGYLKTGGSMVSFSEDQDFKKLQLWTCKTDFLLDGILGTGTTLPLRGEALEVLTFLSQHKHSAKVIAVDCPSGVDCDGGEASEVSLKADLTICMAAAKIGLINFPAFNFVGEISAIDIGLPDNLAGWKDVRGEVVSSEQVFSWLPERPLDGHKGTFGTCMVIAGSEPYCGAVILSSEAAYRVGAGLVQAVIPENIYTAVAGQVPEAIWLKLPEDDGAIRSDAIALVKNHLTRKSVLLVGPGWGIGSNTGKFLENLLDLEMNKKNVYDKKLLKNHKNEVSEGFPAMVIDADAIKLLAAIPDWIKKIPPGSVLTPHPGEMSVLTGKSVDAIQSERIGNAVHYAREWGQTVVLKGACTLIANADGDYTVIPLATSALSTAGTGDILAGMIAGLMAQGMKSYQAAIASAWLHAQAGYLAAERLGSERCVLARDILKSLCDVLNKKTGH